MNWIQRILDTSDFPARWNCGNWSDLHGWIHIVSDLATAAAYYAIPITLIYFVIRRKDAPFLKLFLLFGAFILSCGTVHLIEATIFWHPWYRLSALAKAGTALISIITAIFLIRHLPLALSLPGLQHYANELEKKNKELDDFTRMASHDLKEPLIKLTALGDLLREDLKNQSEADIDADIREIQESTQQMQTLVNNLLEYSRAGHAAMKKETVRLDECIQFALETLEHGIGKHEAEIVVHPQPSVQGDARLLKQLFQNLISNALKYARPDVPPRIEVTAAPVDGEWIFGVKDNGIGIPLEHRERVFDTFCRLHSRANVEGTGIGLAICRKAVERHGGRIWFNSDATGTHFKFTLSPVHDETVSPGFHVTPEGRHKLADASV